MSKTSKKKHADAISTADEKAEAKANAKPMFKHCYLLLKSATCSKLSQHASGGIEYQVLSDPAKQHLSIRIAENAGGGYYSREVVPFAKVVACRANVQTDRPFPSKVFKSAFIGRSSNNAGFLAAILRAEKLLLAAPDAESQHISTEDWATWEKTMLTGSGERIEIDLPIPAEPADDDGNDIVAPESRKTLTLKRSKTGDEKAGD